MNTRKTYAVVLSALVIMTLAASASAQERRSTSYTGLQLLLPTGDAADFYDAGFGLTGSSQFPLGSAMDFVLEGAWYNFSGKQFNQSGLDLESEDLSILAFMGGVAYDAGTLEFGAKGGYFFNDLHEWDIMPYAQVSFGRFSVGGEYKALGNMNWGAVYAKFRWQE